MFLVRSIILHEVRAITIVRLLCCRPIRGVLVIRPNLIGHNFGSRCTSLNGLQDWSKERYNNKGKNVFSTENNTYDTVQPMKYSAQQEVPITLRDPYSILNLNNTVSCWAK